MIPHSSYLSTHVQCSECPIRHRAVCARCDGSELQDLDALKYYRTIPAGQGIIWAGDTMDFVASIVSGIATLTHTMEDGRTQMVGLLLPSDFVGRPGRPRAAYDVTATTDVTLCCFRKKPFEDLMARTPNLAQRLLEMTLDELDAAREWMLLLGRKTAREKIATLLAIIIRRDASLSAPQVEELGVLDAIVQLASESSSLSSLPAPLQTLAAFLEARPPTLLVTYAEAEQARDLLVDALEES